MPGDTTLPISISFLTPKDLPRWFYGRDDESGSIASTTIDGIALYVVFDEHSQLPEVAPVEGDGEPWSAAPAGSTDHPLYARAKLRTFRGYSDPLAAIAAAVLSPVRHLVVQFTPYAPATDPGKTFRDSVVLFQPVKLTIGLPMAQWPTIYRCLVRGP